MFTFALSKRQRMKAQVAEKLAAESAVLTSCTSASGRADLWPPSVWYM